MDYEVKGKYEIYDKRIPEDFYWLKKIIWDDKGTLIRLYSDKKTVDIQFGGNECICQSDEGNRMVTYGTLDDIKGYMRNNFVGNPLFIVKDSNFIDWCNTESYGIHSYCSHFAIITENDFVDVFSIAKPEIIIKRRIDNPIFKIKRIMRNIKKKHKKKKKEKQNRISNK